MSDTKDQLTECGCHRIHFLNTESIELKAAAANLRKHWLTVFLSRLVLATALIAIGMYCVSLGLTETRKELAQELILRSTAVVIPIGLVLVASAFAALGQIDRRKEENAADTKTIRLLSQNRERYTPEQMDEAIFMYLTRR